MLDLLFNASCTVLIVLLCIVRGKDLELVYNFRFEWHWCKYNSERIEPQTCCLQLSTQGKIDVRVFIIVIQYHRH